MTMLDEPLVASTTVSEAYPDCPSVGRLLTEAAAESAWHMEATLHPTSWRDPGYTRERQRNALLLRGVLLDIVALQSTGDLHSAAQAAQAGGELQRLDGYWRTGAELSRAYLREQYRAWRTNEHHPWDCPGNCGGTGIVMQTLIWENQGEGIYYPVHEEPMDCGRGQADQEHGPDCACHGSGFTFEGGDRNRCLAYFPVAQAVQDTSDPWGSWEPPF